MLAFITADRSATELPRIGGFCYPHLLTIAELTRFGKAFDKLFFVIPQPRVSAANAAPFSTWRGASGIRDRGNWRESDWNCVCGICAGARCGGRWLLRLPLVVRRTSIRHRSRLRSIVALGLRWRQSCGLCL